MSVIAIEVEIDASPEEVWAVLADFNAVEKWSPSVRTAHGISEKERGIGAVRGCDVPGFGKVEETIVDWKDGESLTFEVSAVGPVKKTVMTWSVRAENGRTIARVRSEMHTKFGVIGVVMDKLVMRRMFKTRMGQTLLGLKHHVETGEEIGTRLPGHHDKSVLVDVAG
ncbi:MAG: SRPBCC family protein [Planctomycetes bacterium]|nr:SRPBCC family protein [Planctomycetota bacterium]